MMTIAGISFEDVPRGRVAVLPHVETSSLTFSEDGSGYATATHMSCPSARYTSITYGYEVVEGDVTPEEIFPYAQWWKAVVYTISPVEEVTLEISMTPIITCKLACRSACAAAVELCFKIAGDEGDGEDNNLFIAVTAFIQAAKAIVNLPQLASLKRFHICHSLCFVAAASPRIANEVSRLFEHIEKPTVFPPIRAFAISHPLGPSDGQCTIAVVGLAKSHHALGIPFERVTIRGERMFAGTEEGLKPWVGGVEYRYEGRREADGGWGTR
jgi:hypothetical protein